MIFLLFFYYAFIALALHDNVKILHVLVVQETQGVLVASFSDSKQFPAFFTRDSGYQAPYNVASHLEAAKIIGKFVSEIYCVCQALGLKLEE